MKNTKITEHTKNLKIETSAKWKKEKVKEGGYNYNVLITDENIASYARNMRNKTEFLKNAIKKEMQKELT